MPTINLPGLGPIDIFGSSTPPAPAAAPAAQDTSVRDTYIQQLAAAHGGLVGGAAPVTTPKKDQNGKPVLDDNGIQKTDWSGYDTFTFADGSKVEASPDGQFRNPVFKAASTTDNSPANVAAKSGQLIMPGGQVYIQNPDKSPGQPPYILDPTSQNNQQIETAKSVAATNLSTAQAAVQNADAKLKLDPTNIQLQQDKDKAQAALNNAQANAATLNANSTAQRVGAQNALDTAQAGAATSNAASTAQNAQSTAARVGSQNALDTAQAGLASTNAQVAAGRLPSQVALDTAQAANQNAAAASALAKAAEPTVWNANTTAPTTQYYDPVTKQVVTSQNPNYLPTDPGRMTAQLKQQADQQWQQLQQQVQAGKITGDQAASQFDKYWGDNIEPLKGTIAQAQAAQQSALALQAAQTGLYSAQAANYPASLAQTASDAAQKNAIAMLPYTTGAGYGDAVNQMLSGMGSGKFPKIDPQALANAATFSLPNLQEIGRQGAAAALANFSPTAQMHAGMTGAPAQPQQMPGPADLSSMLNLNSYYGGGNPRDMMSAQQLAQLQNTTGQPGGAQVGGNQNVANGPIPYNTNSNAAAPPQTDWNALMARQQQSAQEQAIQAQLFPVAGAPTGVPPGMTQMVNNPWQSQYGSAVGMPATGPVAGVTGAYDAGSGWHWPPYQAGFS